MTNSTVAGGLPPLPTYTLEPMPDLLPFISDFWLSIILPHLCYWVVSLFFHVIDTYDLFPQYRLHTPAEIIARNHASRLEVARDVVVEQLIQVVTTVCLSMSEPVQMIGKENYDVAVWARRIRLAQRALPAVLGLVGLNAAALAKSMSASHPLLAGALAGGHYPFLAGSGSGSASSVVGGGSAGPVLFAAWELVLAKTLYWAVVPAFQLWLAVVLMDSWQYFWHRLMHTNKWMYVHFHARHHRLYVPYAYGALYNHPLEGFVLDIAGAALAYKASGMTQRMSIFFFVFSTAKTVDDHCGYALPWDPLQHITSNNAAYHDIHHQSWGIKTNFSQPFFTIWDRMLGTMWHGDTQLRYARDRNNAARKVAAAAAATTAQNEKPSTATRSAKAAATETAAAAAAKTQTTPTSNGTAKPARKTRSSR